jgi:thiol:disulfide interchange protein DsbD
MASPFLLLTVNPRWLKLLPKPGNWMITFKQFMGFMLMGTVVWLVTPLGTQIGADGLVWALAFLLFVGLAAWLLGKITPLSSTGKRASIWIAAVLVIVLGWSFSFRGTHTISALADAERKRMKSDCPPTTEEDCGHYADRIPAAPWSQIPWQRWRKGLPERLAQCGYTVYVDFTATWCANCLANKKVFLETEATRHKMADLCVIPMKADFTAKDPDIFEVIQNFGRSGVPLNVIYPAGKPDHPIVMPEFLGSVDFVAARLDEAGKSVGACPNHGAALTAATNGN